MGCVACMFQIHPEDFCTSWVGFDFPEFCGGFITLPPPIDDRILEECCREDATRSCSDYGRDSPPHVIGVGITTDYTEVGSFFITSNGECFSEVIRCCEAMTLECLACSARVRPEEFCDDPEHSERYPEICVTITPIDRAALLAQCCRAEAETHCLDLGFAFAVGHGPTDDYRQVGTTYTMHLSGSGSGSCTQQDTHCCHDLRNRACVACLNGVPSQELCNEHADEYPQFCPQIEPCRPCRHGERFCTHPGNADVDWCVNNCAGGHCPSSHCAPSCQR